MIYFRNFLFSDHVQSFLQPKACDLGWYTTVTLQKSPSPDFPVMILVSNLQSLTVLWILALVQS